MEAMEKLDEKETNLMTIVVKVNEIVEYLQGPIHKKGKRRHYDEQFQYFWSKFKGRWDEDRGYVKVGKYQAWLEWQKLTKAEKCKAAASSSHACGKYLPDPCRWLKKKMFEDDDCVFNSEAMEMFESLGKHGI